MITRTGSGIGIIVSIFVGGVVCMIAGLLFV